MANSIEIPIKDMDKIIEIQTSQLPDPNELHNILKNEHSELHIWVNLALEYYKKGNSVAFVKLLESSRSNSCLKYKDSDKDQMRALDMLAAYYVQTANREKNKEKRIKLFARATELYTTGDKILMDDVNHLLGRAFFCLLDDNKIDQANAQFNFILSQSLNNIPAQLGKACIAFNRKDYKRSLEYYKNVLRSNPNCPADVRLGLAHCFLKLGNIEKACSSFERTLELDPKCMGALVGLAIMKLNSECYSDIKIGITLMSEAYKIDPTNPSVLNHLSNHFFFKKNYKKSQNLAIHALQNTEYDAIKAESCYYIARSYHAENNYERAFQYYYQATQLAPITFVLPHYGLGQMYIHGGDIENAAQCFEKVLKTEPESNESMKILASLYADSNNQQKRDIAKNYLKKIIKYNPDDLEAWIEFAKILEPSDLEESLSAYNTAINLLRKNQNNTIPPEILNNVAALNYRLGNLDQSLSQLEESLSLSKKMATTNQEHYTSIVVTTSYNLARVLEAQSQFQKAEIYYKNILKEHPNYIDCYLRLGCMSRDRNQIYEASDWLKEALRFDNDNPNALSLLGNLHLSKNEWGPGQKKFEHILKNPSTLNDSYALIALGNVWLHTLYQQNKNKDQQKKHQALAMQFYTKVLRYDPKNIWATNGVGCVLAHQNYINEAGDIFAQVREVTTNFPDVWLNIAHLFIEQKQYISGIQMYEQCIKTFYKYDNVDVLQYLGRAYYLAEKFKEAKVVFSKARRVAPQDTVIIYNLALTLQKLAVQVLKDKQSNLKIVLQAVRELGLSRTYFQYLSIHGDHVQYDLKLAGIEANRCQDLMNQADYHVKRARQKDIEEREIRQKREKELELLIVKQNEDKANEMQFEEGKKNEILKKRQEYLEKTKNAIMMFHTAIESPKLKRKPRMKKSSAHGGSFSSEEEENKCPKKSKKSGQSDNSTKKKKVNIKCRKEICASTRSTSTNVPVLKKKSLSNSNKKVCTLSKQKLRIVSKEFISTSEENSSEDEEIKK